MAKKSSSIIGPIKRIIYIIMVAIFLILVSFISLQSMAWHREHEDKLIDDAFGEQKMYTQMISKDVNLIYVLLQSMESGYKHQSKAEVNESLSEVREDLAQVRDEFAFNLAALHRKEITVNSETVSIDTSVTGFSESLKAMDDLWAEFDLAITTILKAEQVDARMTKAFINIKENNKELAEYCDDLQTIILESTLKDDETRQYLVYGFIGLLFLAILFYLYQLQHYLIQPFSQLYKGIAEIGIISLPAKPNYPTKKKILPIVSEINGMFHNFDYLKSLIENMNNNNSFMETLNFISSTFSSFIPYNYIGIALISEDKRYLKASYGVSDGTITGLPERIRGVSWLTNDTSLGALINSGEARIINDLEEYCKDKPLKKYNKMILEAGIRSSITLPLKVSGDPVGVIFFSSAGKNLYTKEHLNILRTLANSISISLNQNILVSDIVYSSILALAKLAEARDEDTGEHLDRMSGYTKLIAELLYENYVYTDEIDLEYIDNVERFSPLHDIGKVGIRDNILLKPGKLTPEEFNEMKKHAVYGAEVLKSAEKNMKKMGKRLVGMGVEIAEGHHEKWDGSGYPNGKKGEDIPVSARIVAMADVFDALTSKRPYKEAFSLDSAMNIIAEGRGKHFDPSIVDVFLANRRKIESIYNKFKTHNAYE